MSAVGKYMEPVDHRKLSQKLVELSEKQEADRYPLPLRYQITRIVLLLSSSLILIGIGGALVSHTNNIAQTTILYDKKCTEAGEQVNEYERKCDKFSITIDQKLSSPVYVYYHLTQVWQNHFLYIRALSSEQIFGEDVTDTSACEGSNFGVALYKGADDKTLFPCGLQTWSQYNDEIIMNATNADGSVKCNVTECLSYENIALDIDKDRLTSFDYNDPNNDQFTNKVPAQEWNGQGIRGEVEIPDLQDESLLIWLRYASSSNFKKIHSIIHYDLNEGDVLEFSITNKFNNSLFNGKKELILSEAGKFGGKQEILSILFLASGLITFLIVSVTLCVHAYIAKQHNVSIW